MAPPVLESARAVRLEFNGAFVCPSAMERSPIHFTRRFYWSLIQMITDLISVVVRFGSAAKIKCISVVKVQETWFRPMTN